MFFGILNFDSNRAFCKDYSLCIIADFENRIISGIFSRELQQQQRDGNDSAVIKNLRCRVWKNNRAARAARSYD